MSKKLQVPGSSETTVGKLPVIFRKQKLVLVTRFSFRAYKENEMATIAGKEVS